MCGHVWVAHNIPLMVKTIQPARYDVILAGIIYCCTNGTNPASPARAYLHTFAYLRSIFTTVSSTSPSATSGCRRWSLWKCEIGEALRIVMCISCTGMCHLFVFFKAQKLSQFPLCIIIEFIKSIIIYRQYTVMLVCHVIENQLINFSKQRTVRIHRRNQNNSSCLCK